MTNLNEVLVIIPSYCPPDNLPQLLERLKFLGLKNFLIVNDGSPERFSGIFNQIRKQGVLVVDLVNNTGKGNALKHGISLARESFPGVGFYVFCDDDGQHDPDDVTNLCLYGLKTQSEFLIGTRDLNKMPVKSFIGNLTMRMLLKIFKGISIPDTQSGLRFMRKTCAEKLLNIQHERFSFELHALLTMKDNQIPLQTFPIKTIYFNKNSSTRFLVFQDSREVIGSLFVSPKNKDKLK